MSYYCFNRKEIFQKAKERYSKEKSAEYYLKNKEKKKKKKIKELIKTRLKSTKKKDISN